MDAFLLGTGLDTAPQDSLETPQSAAVQSAAAPVVIVGAGPVGVRLAQELHRRQPGLPLIIYGDEPFEPYNRVRLSSYLVGEVNWHGLTRDLALPEVPHVQSRFGCAVTTIDREQHCIIDSSGARQPYSRLILATGSRPHVPEIPGIHLPGVYTFRNVRDAQTLLARRVRSRRTVILGGGLLGLEAARAMQRYNTEICVIEHYSRLMMRQLDDGAAAYLLANLKALGIEVLLGEGIKRVEGAGSVTGITLRNDQLMPCDTLLVATGIVPNVELARAAGLHIGRGIRVNDAMQTSDPDIYAAGECAEHRDRVYGIVAPGLEQAAIAAHRICGGDANYHGSTIATRLKVLDLPVFSMGPVGAEETPDFARTSTYRTPRVYRKLVTRRGRLIGAIAIGLCPEINRLQEAVMRQRRVWPWQQWRFRREGLLWPPEELSSVVAWPASTTVCNCTGVTRGQLGAAMTAGCCTIEALAARTGASTVCGSCRPLLAELAGSSAPPEPVRGWRWLLGAGVAGMLLAAVMALPLNLSYAESAQSAWQWDLLWRDSFWKQVSGYTAAGLSALLLIMSLRKRIRRFTLGDFSLWRVAHSLIGGCTVAALAVHTGGRLGENLNLALIGFFIGMVAVGAAAGGITALEHRMGAGAARLRRAWQWTHILLFWPIPALLALHVFKSYYF